MKHFLFLMAGITCLCLLGCSKEDNDQGIQLSFDLNTGMDGWSGDFADYPEGSESYYGLDVGHENLPAPLDQTQKAIMQTGINHSDDLFMFIKKKIDGLIPNATYAVKFNVQFATNAPDNAYGVGGAPGKGVFIKAGLTSQEPLKFLDDDGYYRMNIDKGNQSVEGEDMINLGDFANGTDTEEYKLKTLVNTSVYNAKANAAGELWLVFGTDSGFEATTTIYYTQIKITLN